MTLNFPNNPIPGQVYTANGESWSWDGRCWQAVSGVVTYSPVFIGSFPPALPNPGDLWWNSDTGRMCIYYVDADSAQWVSAYQPKDQMVTISSEQVVQAFLEALPEHASIASASQAGMPVGGIFRITGTTTVEGLRAVASYLV